MSDGGMGGSDAERRGDDDDDDESFDRIWPDADVARRRIHDSISVRYDG
jgi:hypothetical protein